MKLVFFAVQEDQRGTGIGKNLLNGVLNYMQCEKINRFYLYTDSSCNYGFYESQGFKRKGEKNYSLSPYKTEAMRFFISEYKTINSNGSIV